MHGECPRCGARDTDRTQFKNSWSFIAIVVTNLVGQLATWEVSSRFGLRSNPMVVAFLCTGLVAAMVSVLYEEVGIG